MSRSYKLDFMIMHLITDVNCLDKLLPSPTCIVCSKICSEHSLICRLAILSHDKANDDSQPHISNYKDSSSHPSMVDSRKSGFSTSGEGSMSGSRSNSMAFTGSVGIPSRASELSINSNMDSRRSLQPSSSFGSNDGTATMKSIRSSSTLAGDLWALTS